MSTKKKERHSKDAFYFYLLDFKKKNEKKGVVFKGMEEVAQQALTVWNKLSQHEKWIYEEEERKHNILEKINFNYKLPVRGKGYVQVQKEINEAKEKEISMMSEIENTVRFLISTNFHRTYVFYIIHVNYYCQQVCGVFIPCEIALAAFNFLEGVTKTYHKLINPQQIPLGYKFEAMKHSAETHQIPVPPENPGGETDYQEVLMCVKRFLRRQGGQIPPLYTHPNDIEAVNSVLCQLQESVDADFYENMFRVYSLTKLFYELHNACMGITGALGFPCFSLAEKELDRTNFSYAKGISCSYHENTDALPYCSLNYVKRWSFNILDYCCRDLEIHLVPGHHCPPQANTSQFEKENKYHKNLATKPPTVVSNTLPSEVNKSEKTYSYNDENKDSIVSIFKDSSQHESQGSEIGLFKDSTLCTKELEKLKIDMKPNDTLQATSVNPVAGDKEPVLGPLCLPKRKTIYTLQTTSMNPVAGDKEPVLEPLRLPKRKTIDALQATYMNPVPGDKEPVLKPLRLPKGKPIDTLQDTSMNPVAGDKEPVLEPLRLPNTFPEALTHLFQ